MALLPCIQSQVFILGFYIYLQPGSLSLWSLFSKNCFLLCFPLVCDLALGSSFITAVNLYFMQILLLASLTAVACDGFPACATVVLGRMDKCHKTPLKSCGSAKKGQSRCPLSRCIYSAFPFIKGLKVVARGGGGGVCSSSFTKGDKH